MKIRYVDKNDRIAVWFWFKNPMSCLFTKNKNHNVYSKHCEWFDAMCKKGNLIIGVQENLRIGLGLVIENKNKLAAKFFIKPVYCGHLGSEFVIESCKFLYKEKNKKLNIDCFGNEKINQDLISFGLSKSERNYLKFVTYQ